MFGQETLTGFKWMGNRARDLLDQDKTVLFAFEEAIGIITRSTPTQMTVFKLRPVLIHALWLMHTMISTASQAELILTA